jgi:hypothetical protein
MCDAIMDGLSDRGFSPGWRKDFEKRVDIAKQAGLDIAGAKWPRVRRKAHKAANAMAELIGELSPSMAIDFQNTRQKLELLTTAEGPDPRTSPQDWVLAFLGWRFVEQHSPDRPVTTQAAMCTPLCAHYLKPSPARQLLTVSSYAPSKRWPSTAPARANRRKYE